jgi:hypothetical protein
MLCAGLRTSGKVAQKVSRRKSAGALHFSGREGVRAGG